MKDTLFFLTCSWRFLISDELEQLEFKLEKIIGIRKHAGKVRKGPYEGPLALASFCNTLKQIYDQQPSEIRN